MGVTPVEQHALKPATTYLKSQSSGLQAVKISPCSYEELRAKGVKFTKQRTKEFYGFNAVFADDSGNWFSLGNEKSLTRVWQ